MTEVLWPWPAGVATGVGSMPGVDIVETTRMIIDELPELPHIPEMPERGPGADMVGRGAALLADIPVELYAATWRVTSRAGRDLRIARDFLERDLDTLTEQASGYSGAMKIQAVGPWTLAASLHLASGGPVLRDVGATRDLALSCAEGMRSHIADVKARLPHADIFLQIDEPSLPNVLAGRVPTESGLGALPAVDESTVRNALAMVIETAGVPVVVHCCATGAPLDVIREAGARGIGLDLALIDDLDLLGNTLDAGLGLIAGAADTRRLAAGGPLTRSQRPACESIASRVRQLWTTLGFPITRLSSQVVVSPACGLAGLSSAEVKTVLTSCREAARRLAEGGA